MHEYYNFSEYRKYKPHFCPFSEASYPKLSYSFTIQVVTLDGDDGRARDVVRGFGLLRDPGAIDWLIDKIEVPELARQAGGSITMITGIDLV